MPFCPSHHTPLVSSYRSSSLIGQKPHPLQVKLAARLNVTVRLQERKVVGRKTRGTVLSRCSEPSRKFQHGTYVLWGVVWASAEQWR